MRAVCAAQDDNRDLPMHPEPRGRSPVSSAAADVQPRAADAMQTGDDRLKETDDQIERKELAAMGVAGKLKIDAEVRCGARRLRAMRQQNLHGVARCVLERGTDVLLVAVSADRIG